MQALVVTNQVAGQNLERDSPAEFGVLSKINFAHPAFAEQGNDFVVADSLTGRKYYLFVHKIRGSLVNCQVIGRTDVVLAGRFTRSRREYVARSGKSIAVGCCLLPDFIPECSLTTGSGTELISSR